MIKVKKTEAQMNLVEVFYEKDGMQHSIILPKKVADTLV